MNLYNTESKLKNFSGCIRIPGVFSLLFLLPIFYTDKISIKIIWGITAYFSFMADYYYAGQDSDFLAIDRIWAVFVCIYILCNFISLKSIYLLFLVSFSFTFYLMSMIAIEKNSLIEYNIYHSLWHIFGAYTGVFINKYLKTN